MTSPDPAAQVAERLQDEPCDCADMKRLERETVSRGWKPTPEDDKRRKVECIICLSTALRTARQQQAEKAQEDALVYQHTLRVHGVHEGCMNPHDNKYCLAGCQCPCHARKQAITRAAEEGTGR